MAMIAKIKSNDFNRAVSAAKEFASKDPNRLYHTYIRLEFCAADSCMTAVAVDGYRMSVEHAVCQCEKDFVTYIHPSIKLPKHLDAIIESKENETIIRCDGIIFGCSTPKGQDHFLDWRKALPAEPTFRIAFNPEYLMDALKAAKVSRTGKPRDPVVLEFGAPNNPVVFRTGKDNIKMVMPIRIKD